MANSSFFKNTGTSTQIQGSANASAAAALASEQAALVSENAAQTSETNSAASAAAALVSKNAAATSAASANSDASAASSSATAAQTAATSSSANAASTSVDATQTAADRVQTGLDRVATAADAVQTASDRVQTGLDVTSSSASAAAALSSRNAAATSETNAAASAASSSADATATASDRVQTGLDAASTAADAIATAADRVQTGLDATASATSASAASTSATAAAASQVSAASSAASAAAVFNDFEDRYYGPHASDSAAQTHVTGLGLTVDQGDLYFNSTANEMRVYDGGSWIAASSAGGASLINYNYTATASQTAFTGSDDNNNTLSYTVDNLIVTRNGVVLEDGTDYTATDGSTITLTVAAAAGDEINVVAFKSFTTADMVSATNGGAFQGNVDFAAGADVTGNITVTGTVDGRDVATDGTKLDGIEAGADVTDATNVAAAGALMTTGGSVTGNVSFGDNDKAIFGAGSDLQIYHSGGASHIDDVGTGDFKISTDGAGIYLNKGGSENMASFLTDGAVTLYYDNAAKLATKATGAQINGQLDVQNTAGNVVTGVRATEFGYSSTYQVTQVGDTSGNKSVSIAYDPYTNTSGSFTGNGSEVLFRNGVEFMTPNSGNTGFHNNVLVMKDGNIGIGQSNPTRTFEVTDGTSGKIRASGTAGGFLECWDGTYGVYFGSGLAISGSGNSNDSIIWTEGGGAQRFLSSGLERMRIDSSGRVTMPYQPAFWAYSGNTYTYTTTGALEFNSSNVGLAEQYDVGNNYNPSTGRFTAPVAGTYQITLTAAASYNSNYLYMYIMKNGTAFIARNFPQSSDYQNMPLNAVITLAAGDYISCKTEKNATGGALYAPSFTGFLIG